MHNVSLTSSKQQVLLVGVNLGGASADIDELERLADTDGVEVIDTITQRRDKPDPAYYIGRGKADEICNLINEYRANEKLINAVIFDNDLSPAQVRNLEQAFNPGPSINPANMVRVIDRTELILDIFATHARTRQAKLQVELARLEYAMPRLKHLWGHFSRIAGRAKIGRGPGEKQLEVDRRLARDRIISLKKELEHIKKHRHQEVAARSENFTVCLVGYTNAGKSTLMNKLTRAGVLVEDKLFSTLDTKTHIWKLKSGQKVLLSDTVGFIHNLPHNLVASFQATLEETAMADLLLHIVDSSSDMVERQLESVQSVLKELGCGNKRVLILLNKVDRADPMDVAILQKQTNGIAVSALRGDGLEILDRQLENIISEYQREWDFKIPLDNGRVLAYLAGRGKIVKQSVTNKYIKVKVRLGQRDAYKAITMGAVNNE